MSDGPGAAGVRAGQKGCGAGGEAGGTLRRKRSNDRVDLTIAARNLPDKRCCPPGNGSLGGR
ncbi:hypothetical protein SLNWT_0980 [Streptomyces albus]|uniref:Uncharacterized protein n=1 Tax=Streptomyces albus (strain ATCC 21838 / DSM 41398 / FERM P-419 / JCM 4703 / NBRC 107858) TaxID=1081613 RepID=A0A0B5ERI6_STRA4|nr:hypothetical protein SLNWT_0980 [Streptomyces albus]AOU75672.1 hypothetical protein SLNHY_0981 [Streptomyces albus]AYN31473.1 hypothetical protein DUI70_0971 [Streptomyces albus]